MEYDFDLLTIGAGSGGVRASRVAAGFGARVAIVEEAKLGGTCVNVGCVPKKLFTYAAHYRHDFADAAGFGWTVAEPRFDWAALIAAKDEEIKRLNSVYARLLDNAGVTRIAGRGRLVDPHTVEVSGAAGEVTRHSAERILVAVGSCPTCPDVPGVELGITSNEAFFLTELPSRVVVVGGGYIASEFAGIFHGLGCEVVQLYRGALFLRGFDDDVRRLLAEQMRQSGIDLRFETNVTSLGTAGAGVRAHLTQGEPLDAGLVMFATGRRPNTQGLGLEAAGVRTDERGAIVVDDNLKTNVDSVYALGDVINRITLTPMALAEGMALANTLFGSRATVPDYEGVPSAVFSSPPVSVVGLSEQDARQRFSSVDVYRSTFTPLKHQLTGRGEKMMMKLVVDADSDRVVGCHVVGADAAEIVQGFAVAMKCGATKAQLDATVGIHPTAAEELVTMRARVEPGAPG